MRLLLLQLLGAMALKDLEVLLQYWQSAPLVRLQYRCSTTESCSPWQPNCTTHICHVAAVQLYSQGGSGNLQGNLTGTWLAACASPSHKNMHIMATLPGQVLTWAAWWLFCASFCAAVWEAESRRCCASSAMRCALSFRSIWKATFSSACKA